MNNNGLVEYKESFVLKIRKLFKRIFGKSEESYKHINHTQKESKIESKADDFLQDIFVNDLKVDVNATNTVIERNAFLKELEGNEKALKMLSIDRLKKLEEYYDDIIEQNNERIKKLKKAT